MSHQGFKQRMVIDTLVTLFGGLLGGISIWLSWVAYRRLRQTNYRRILLPIVMATTVFTLAHGLLLLWPRHPPIVDLLEPISFTILAVGVVSLSTIHPTLSTIGGDDHQ